MEAQSTFVLTGQKQVPGSLQGGVFKEMEDRGRQGRQKNDRDMSSDVSKERPWG